MSKFGVSQSVFRKEDERFTTGQGRFVDDIAPKDAFHAVFFRSPVAHADITSVDVEAARSAPGVRLILTADDLGERVKNQMNYSVLEDATNRPSSRAIRPVLATGRVRFVGEPIAIVVADTLAQARDAAEMIEFDFEDLDAHLTLAKGGPQIHEDAPDNVVFDWAFGDADKTHAAFKAAAHTAGLDLVDNRVICNSMEPRGCYAQMKDARLHFCFNGQGVWGAKREMADKLGMAPEDIRVTNPDVGGGFGMKAFNYPEYFAVAEAARRLGHGVRWMSDRSEAMLSDNGGRDLVTRAEAAFDADYKLQAVRIHSDANMGAYSSGFAQFIQTELALKVLTGVYDVQTVHFGVQGIFTNTTQVDAYRGAGRPEAIYVMERLMDSAARQFGQDPITFRAKSFITADQMPYVSSSGETYDVGDFQRVLDRAMGEADVAGFAARKAQSAKDGKLRGIGLSYYIESILGDQTETTKIEFADDGMVNLYVGTQSNGQGHETVFAQILNQRAGIPFDKIRMIQGDSDLIATGGGTGGSRSVTIQGNSLNVTADAMIDKFKPLAEEELEAAAADIVFEDGAFIIAGTDRKVDMITLAEKARKAGELDLLVTQETNTVEARSFPNGAHFAEVEVDMETGITACVKYTVVDDFGVLMNPMLAEGQVHGGVAQGIGQAITENVVYDEDGQLLTGSFMDYGMPRADDIPDIPFHAELIPSTANDIGMKGCGEAGTVGALAAVTNAALDAVWDQGVHHVDMPLTPLSMWQRLNAARQAAE